MSASMPPADLRARVLAAARAEPSPPRARGLLPRVLLLTAGFGATAITLALLGGPDPGGRPSNYFVSVTLLWLAVGAAALWVSVFRGSSMLGRPVSWKVAVAALTPVALGLSALFAGLAWPAVVEPPPAHVSNHLACLMFTLVMAIGPFTAFVALRRGSDPIAPRVTGGAVGATAGTLGGICIELVCERESFVHVAVGHVLPVVALTLLGVWLGGNVLRVKARALQT